MCFPVNFAKKFKNTDFEEHLRTAASEHSQTFLAGIYADMVKMIAL